MIGQKRLGLSAVQDLALFFFPYYYRAVRNSTFHNQHEYCSHHICSIPAEGRAAGGLTTLPECTVLGNGPLPCACLVPVALIPRSCVQPSCSFSRWHCSSSSSSNSSSSSRWRYSSSSNSSSSSSSSSSRLSRMLCSSSSRQWCSSSSSFNSSSSSSST